MTGQQQPAPAIRNDWSGGSNRQERSAGPASTNRPMGQEEASSMTHYLHRPDPDAVIAEMWPVDGPYTGDASLSAARAAADLLGYLAHATRQADALPAPADAA